MKAFYSMVFALAAGVIVVPCYGKDAAAEEAACLKAYHKVHEQLAKDDLPAAQKAATELAAKADAAKSESLAKHARELAKSSSLDSVREHFKAVSQDCIKMAEGIEGQHLFHCPMVKADWLQTDMKVSNPYMGKKMPDCGALKKKK
ncbi:MAG: DUF3347 domain-containing protein [Verrucomicrobiales bacterium]